MNHQYGQSMQEYLLVLLLLAAPLFVPFQHDQPALAVQFYEQLTQNIRVWEYSSGFAD